MPARRRPGTGDVVTVRGAREHNLKDVDVSFPLGCLIAVTGVSGSGKSTLVNDILLRSLAQTLHRAKTVPGLHRKVEGMAKLDKVVDVDQAPIGRTPRSNPATYTGVFDHIRKLFAQTAEAKVRGYQPGRFSFNVRGGRCEACAGDGTIKIEMHFLPDVYVPCEICHGARYNRDTLEITFRGKTIADVLDLSCEEALSFFAKQPPIARHMQTLVDVGLGYVRLGQPAPTLSGGEAQRVKLASELSRRPTGHTFYILDEPTTGLHFEDTRRLLEVLGRLVEQGNTVVVIEHNLDVDQDGRLDHRPRSRGRRQGRHRHRRGHAGAGGQDGGQLHGRGAQAGAGESQVTRLQPSAAGPRSAVSRLLSQPHSESRPHSSCSATLFPHHPIESLPAQPAGGGIPPLSRRSPVDGPFADEELTQAFSVALDDDGHVGIDDAMGWKACFDFVLGHVLHPHSPPLVIRGPRSHCVQVGPGHNVPVRTVARFGQMSLQFAGNSGLRCVTTACFHRRHGVGELRRGTRGTDRIWRAQLRRRRVDGGAAPACCRASSPS